MKITPIPTIKLSFLCTALAGALLTFSDSASAFSIPDAGASSSNIDRSAYVNHLAGMAVRSAERVNGQYFRLDTSTPRAVLSDHLNVWNAGGRIEMITGPLPGGGPQGVPDGGITAMLLGAALGALGMARRYLGT
jgi:hypothetical protein